MLNKVQLIGFIGKEPEIRVTTDGKAVANFSLATSESWKGKDGDKKEVTTWHNIVIYNKLAEIAGEHLHKGSLVFLEGSIKNRSWDKDGETKYITEIVVDSLKMLPNGKGPHQAQEQEAAAPAHAKPAKPAARQRPAAQHHEGPF